MPVVNQYLNGLVVKILVSGIHFSLHQLVALIHVVGLGLLKERKEGQSNNVRVRGAIAGRENRYLPPCALPSCLTRRSLANLVRTKLRTYYTESKCKCKERVIHTPIVKRCLRRRRRIACQFNVTHGASVCVRIIAVIHSRTWYC